MRARQYPFDSTIWQAWPRRFGALTLATALTLSSFATPAALAADNAGGALSIKQTAGETQTSQGGGVTVKATWQGASAGPQFAVVLDTHSVDLDAYDLLQLAVLRTARGQEVQAIGWDAPSGGHHREGTLTFPSVAEDGSPLVEPGAGVIELVVRDVAGVPERVFRWTA